MKPVLKRAIFATCVLIVIFLIIGSIIGQPILISYVETGSMSPAMSPGDGFIAIPSQLDDSIEKGDVIVFDAEEIHDGGLTTHRVVKETNRGYLTQGDANPFTDQDSGEPPVRRPQIVAKALQINGQVLVIPHLGTTVERTQIVLSEVNRKLADLFGTRSLLGTQGIAYLLYAATILWYFIGKGQTGTRERRKRETSQTVGVNSRVIIGVFTVLLVLGSTAAMTVPAGTQEYGVVSSEFESEKPTVIPQGESKTVQYQVSNGGIVPVRVFLEPGSGGVDLHPEEMYINGRTVRNATVTLRAPPETGYYRRFISENRYLAFLPASVIRELYYIHPWAPIIAIDTLIGISFYVIGRALLGRSRYRSRHRSQPGRFVRLIRRYT